MTNTTVGVRSMPPLITTIVAKAAAMPSIDAADQGDKILAVRLSEKGHRDSLIAGGQEGAGGFGVGAGGAVPVLPVEPLHLDRPDHVRHPNGVDRRHRDVLEVRVGGE